VVDDDAVVREGLRNLLCSANFHVRDFPDAGEFLASPPADSPACLILDVYMPLLNGLELQSRLAARGDLLPIIFLTGVGDVPMTVRAMKAGAVEFFTKPFEPLQLLGAVAAAIERDRAARAERTELKELQGRFATLTPREREVMAAVVGGKLNKQIASDFGTKEFTVKEQRAKVMQKMQVSSVAELVKLAARLEEP
jgi:FixJ family two-component response regulator